VKPAGNGEGARPIASVVHIITLLEWGGAQENTLLTCEGLHQPSDVNGFPAADLDRPFIGRALIN